MGRIPGGPCPYKKGCRALLLPGAPAEEQPARTRLSPGQRAVPRTWVCWDLRPRLPASQTVRRCLPRSRPVWYFVTTADLATDLCAPRGPRSTSALRRQPRLVRWLGRGRCTGSRLSRAQQGSRRTPPAPARGSSCRRSFPRAPPAHLSVLSVTAFPPCLWRAGVS